MADVTEGEWETARDLIERLLTDELTGETAEPIFAAAFAAARSEGARSREGDIAWIRDQAEALVARAERAEADLAVMVDAWPGPIGSVRQVYERGWCYDARIGVVARFYPTKLAAVRAAAGLAPDPGQRETPTTTDGATNA